MEKLKVDRSDAYFTLEAKDGTAVFRIEDNVYVMGEVRMTYKEAMGKMAQYIAFLAERKDDGNG